MTVASGSSEAANTDFVSAQIDSKRYRPEQSRALTRGLVVIAIIMVIAVAVPALMIHLK